MDNICQRKRAAFIKAALGLFKKMRWKLLQCKLARGSLSVSFQANHVNTFW